MTNGTSRTFTYHCVLSIIRNIDNAIKTHSKLFIGCRTKNDFVKRYGFKHMVDIGYFRRIDLLIERFESQKIMTNK